MENNTLKEEYVNFLKTMGYDYFVTFTFNRIFAKEDCLQQIEFILKELNKYYFGRKNPVGKLDCMYVDEEQGLRGNNEPHIHLLIKDNAKLHGNNKQGLQERLLRLIKKVGSQRSWKIHEKLRYNESTNKLDFYNYKKSMNSTKHFDFKKIYELNGAVNYVLKDFDRNMCNDFIHI